MMDRYSRIFGHFRTSGCLGHLSASEWMARKQKRSSAIQKRASEGNRVIEKSYIALFLLSAISRGHGTSPSSFSTDGRCSKSTCQSRKFRLPTWHLTTHTLSMASRNRSRARSSSGTMDRRALAAPSDPSFEFPIFHSFDSANFNNLLDRLLECRDQVVQLGGSCAPAD